MKKILLPKTNYIFLFFGLIVLLLLIEVRLQVSIEGFLATKTSVFLKNNLPETVKVSCQRGGQQ